ncbi:MAG TPA: YetF domain-containing protein [Gemmatimonadaceae bacterium]
MSASDFLNDWSLLVRAAVLAACGYLILLIMLRLSGKRTLTKMNVFDFVFVVALGSTLAATILSHDVSLAEGMSALAALILVQVFLSWIITKSTGLEAFINGEPVLIFVHGNFLDHTMKQQRVTKEEIRSAVREFGLRSMEDVEAVVIETDGTFSVIERKGQGPSSLSDVKGYGEPKNS